MRGLFVNAGLTESDLRGIRDAARVALAGKAQIVSYSTPGGLQVAKQFPLPPQEIMMEALYALQLLDPDTYGRSLTIKQTKVRFI